MSKLILTVSKRLLASMLCLIVLAAYLLVQPPVQSSAKNYGQYKDVAKVYDQGSCPSMQGMSVCGNYLYACKINGNTDKEAVVARVNNDSSSSSYGSVTFLTNSATGTKFFSDFGHGNDIEVENINGTTTLFVPTSTSGSGSLVRYKISGTTATKVGNYTMTSGGSNLSGGAIRVTHFDDSSITFLFKSGKVCYTGTLPITQTSGTLEMTKLCTLDYTTAYVNGVAKDTSKYSLQGMGYYDYKLYLPLSGHTVSGHENISIILVYDLEGASGTIKPDPDLTFCITSSQYSAYFEVESCEISPKDGRMYFSANRRVSSSDTNHDGVSYISNWTYDPASREGGTRNYRWELHGDELVSTTDGGNAYNGIYQMEGSIQNGTITNGRFVLSKPITLNHDQPWILEWQSSGTGSGSLLFATEAESKRTDKPYIFRRSGSSLISIGAHDGTSYHNYGLDLADYGINGSTSHIYRMTNKIASDGSNMVYLSVDGNELGALNHHYIASENQNTTSNWISGKDLKFSYLGTLSHKISNCRIDYIQVWHGGLSTIKDEPNTYRWESGMTAATTYSLTENAASLVSGSTSASTYTDCRYDLARDIVLLHDRPWVVEWDNSGSWSTGILMAADHLSNTYKAPYLFRGGSIIAIGHHDGSKHAQWGVKLSEHGIAINDNHTYALKNIIADDGSNMVWLYVDGAKIAPMNTYCTGGTATTTISNELSGKDFVFSHIGTYQHDLTGGMKYLQVWEAGKPEEDQPNNYRWETKSNTLSSISNNNFQSNEAIYLKGSCISGVYSDTQYMMDQPVVLQHNRPWKIEWQCEGAWTGGGLLLSSNLSGSSKNNVYIFRNSKVISIGQYNGTQHEQWGVCPADYGIDHSKLHTYQLVNEISANDGNMVYLYVDGVKIAPLTSVAISGTPNGTTSNWISGKDFVFSYIGSKEYTITKTSLNYLQINEGCSHLFGNWTVTQDATCTSSGSQTRSCTYCGATQTETIDAQGHQYQTVITPPTCSVQGYTTYICSICNDSYIDNYINSSGHNYRSTVIDANCTNPGYTRYTCSVCGDTYTGASTPATGHSYKTTTVEATCTQDGAITSTCIDCGDRQTQIITAVGHTYQTVVIEPTCTTEGYTSHRCHCGDSYTSDPVTALGHSYKSITVNATCTTDGSTTKSCTACGNTSTQVIPATGHSFVSGICGACGEVDPDYVKPVTQPTLKLKAPALEFKDMIKVIAFFTAENLDSVVEMGMITYTENVEVVDITTAAHVIPGAEYDAATGRYYSSSQGIHAKYLGDDVYLAIYAKLSDGSYVYTRLVSYSPITYASNQLKNSNDMNLKQLVAAMLNYGAAAQNYFGYKTDALANAAMTEEQINLPEAYRADMVNTVASPSKDKQGIFANNKGFGTRRPAVSFEGAFSINYFFTPNYTPVDGITMYYWTEAAFNAVDVLTVENASGSVQMSGEGVGQYRGDIEGIAAKSLSEAVYVAAVYSDGTTSWTSGVLGYSIGAYCSSQATKGGTMADLAMATAVYGYHAKAYFD